MIDLQLPRLRDRLRLRHQDQKSQIFDPIRRKWVVFQPEESVRQLFIAYCLETGLCPAGRISVERELEVHGMRRRYDIVLYAQDATPWMLVECKAPSVQLSQATFDQVAQYNLTLRVPYLLITNGWSALACAIDLESKTFRYLDALPVSSP